MEDDVTTFFSQQPGYSFRGINRNAILATTNAPLLSTSVGTSPTFCQLLLIFVQQLTLTSISASICSYIVIAYLNICQFLCIIPKPRI